MNNIISQEDAAQKVVHVEEIPIVNDQQLVEDGNVTSKIVSEETSLNESHNFISVIGERSAIDQESSSDVDVNDDTFDSLDNDNELDYTQGRDEADVTVQSNLEEWDEGDSYEGPIVYTPQQKPTKRKIKENQAYSLPEKRARTFTPEDNKTILFVRKLPAKTTEEDIRKLSPEIISVHIPESSKKRITNWFCFVGFIDEETAEKNLPLLRGKKLGDNEIEVEKSLQTNRAIRAKLEPRKKELDNNAAILKEPKRDAKKLKAPKKHDMILRVTTKKDAKKLKATKRNAEKLKKRLLNMTTIKDNRTLFVRNIPVNTSEDTIKNLSSDITTCRIPESVKNKQLKKWTCFLEFDNEETAEKNLALLKGTKIGDNEIIADYVGMKSDFFKAKQSHSKSESSQ